VGSTGTSDGLAVYLDVVAVARGARIRVRSARGQGVHCFV